MNNLLEAILLFSSDENMKEKFLKEFDVQINSIKSNIEKWENYKIFLKNENTTLLFLEKFDYIFIVKVLIIKAVDDSNISKDNLSIIFFDELKKYFYIKNKKGIDSSELEHSKDLLRDFGITLKQSLLDGAYSGLENQELYKSLKNNIGFLYIILYIVLSYIKTNSNYKVGDLPEFFNGIYQYFHLNRQKKEFSNHLILVTIIIVFFEENNKSFVTQRINHSSFRENHTLLELIESINLEDKDDEFYNILYLLKDFNLLYNFLLKLEKNTWIRKDFIRKNLKLLLLKNDILSNKNIISFSKFFLEYEEKLYFNLIKGIKFEENELLLTLKNAKLDTIIFLNIDENKKYITGKLKDQIIIILRNKLTKEITLSKDYYLMYEYIINSGEKLNLLLENFEYDLVNEFIKDEEGLSFTLKNIDKVLIKKDIDDFYYSIIKGYIENMESGEYLSAKEIREILEINDKTIKDNLKKIKKEGTLIKGASGISRYQVI